MNSSLHSVNTLGMLILIWGFVLFNNSHIAWRSDPNIYGSRNTEQAHQKEPTAEQEYRQVLIYRGLNMGTAIFLMLLGLNMLLKRQWACSFFVSIRQLSQMVLLFIPFATLLLLLNRPLIDELVRIYQPIIQEIIQQQAEASDRPLSLILNDKDIRTAIQATFFMIALFGMSIAGLMLRLCNRCLHSNIQEALAMLYTEPNRWSALILSLPMEFLLLLPLSVYGTTKQLLKMVQTLSGNGADPNILFSLAAFVCFAMALLQLTNKDMQKKQNGHLLKKALNFCSMAYFIHLLQNILPFLTTKPRSYSELSPTAGNLHAVETVANQINSLSNIVVLVMLFFLYRLLQRNDNINTENNDATED